VNKDTDKGKRQALATVCQITSRLTVDEVSEQ